MSTSLLETFRKLEPTQKHAIADIPNPRLLALAALELAETKAGIEQLSGEHIVACLEAAGVTVKGLSVTRALAASKGAVSARHADGEVFYRIMTKGKREIESFLSRGKLSVVRIEKDQPRTARLELRDVFSAQQGLVRICDPYFGVRSLDALDHIPEKCQIRFLTLHISDSQRQVAGAVKDFKKQRPGAEFRVADKGAGLHDRYLVSSAAIVIIGHGLKDLGGKESFLISLDSSIVPELITSCASGFDTKWNDGTPL